MPVNSKHPQYEAHAETWEMVRTVVAGTEAVKSAGDKYLPKLSGQKDKAYEAYAKRAEFHEATTRTVDGLVGAVFRREPSVEVPVESDDLLSSTTLCGQPLAVFSKDVLSEIVITGRYGVLVDVPEGGGEPYMVGYEAEAIINWRVATVEGKPKLVLVVLSEKSYEPDAEDLYKWVEKQRYRVLQLGGFDAEGSPVEKAAAPVYRQQVWRVDKGQAGKEELVLESTVVPTKRAAPLGFLPFVIFGPRNIEATVAKSPISGLAETNLSHYRTSADLEHGAHFTALPTPVVIGEIAGVASEDGKTELCIG